MRGEYDFLKMKGAVRGKYHKAYSRGHKVMVHHGSGRVSVQYFRPAQGAVVLAPDVLKYFPDSRSVNSALRTLIQLIPPERHVAAKRVAAA
jgi:hypothetical protein